MKKSFLNSKFSVFVLLVVLVFALVSLGRESYRRFRVDQEIRNLEKEIGELKEDNEELLKIKEYFQSRAFLEEEARKKFNMLKEGEKLIIIASDQDSDWEESAPQAETAESVSNIKLWWRYFFSKDF